MSEKVTVPGLRGMRLMGKKIVCVTAYDAVFGALADASGADVILVGDSVGNTALGYPSTIPVTVADMVHHTRAVRTGVKRALLVADLPFGSYQGSEDRALDASVALMQAGAEAVKLEGVYPEVVSCLNKAGIPVMGHLGMTPQSVHRFGGFKVQGKGSSADLTAQSAVELDESGVFAIVLELIPADLASRITEEVACPTIGIGAGPCCSGQIQVIYDVLGFAERPFKHAKPYLNGAEAVLKALEEYANEVRSSKFPGQENSF
jgi:3-methyl-2-oxobutanoate hydroxymethyltransferase